MSRGCPEPAELTLLVDGEVTENRADALRVHVSGCSSCGRELEEQRRLVARIGAPLPTRREDAVGALLARLDDAPAPGRWRVPPARLLVGTTALAAAAGLVLVLTPARAPVDEGFAARGAAVAWRQKVGADLWMLGSSLEKLEPGAEIEEGRALVVGYRNLSGAPAFLLAFGVDALGEVHWLYPAYDDPAAHPTSVRLEPTAADRLLDESVVPEGPAAGPIRFLLVTSSEPLDVRSVDSAPAGSLTLASLSARWPEARIQELNATVVARPSRSP